MNKPPYHVPSMAEIAAVPDSGYRSVSTFSGCGGSCLGFRMAGFRVLWANEFEPAAQDSYRLNHPGTILDCRDIREVTASDILRQTGLAEGALDVFEGSPPCTSFSTAGALDRLWGKESVAAGTKRQRHDDLFWEYIRLLGGLRPRMFVAENVRGLVVGKSKGYFKEILRDLKATGYKVEARVLDAQWLGVPQMRRRVIFIGVREDLPGAPAFPSPLAYRYSVREAIPWVQQITVGGQWQGAGRPSGTMRAGEGGFNGRFSAGWCEASHALIAEEDPGETAPDCITGQDLDNLAPGEHGYVRFRAGRVDPETPSPAIVARNPYNTSHPYERRKFTIPELRRLCGFPDDFQLTGSFSERWARLGNSVPPVMAMHIARAIAGTLRSIDEVTP